MNLYLNLQLPSRRFLACCCAAACCAAALLLSGEFPAGAQPSAQSLATQPPTAQPPTAQRFPFVIPWDDAAKTITDVSHLNPAPLTTKHRIRIRDGHFRDDTGRRVRFLATNISGGANFSRHEDIEKVAARLHKLGFNMVRLHHMDAPWAAPNIFHFRGGSYGKMTGVLSGQSLDRLDYMIYQFKRHGIYVDLNLHVTRQWSAADGFPNADRINPEGKVVSYFEPRAIELQKRYARQLLTHFNPYTKTRLRDEPALALIELTNEDSLLGAADSVAGLPTHYKNILARGWNAWLQKQYGSTAQLFIAWNADAKPLGENLIANGRMTGDEAGSENGTRGWVLETREGTSAQMTTEDVSGQTNAPAGRALHLHDLKTDATNWHLQLHQVGLDLQAGETYTVSFAARSNADRPLLVQARRDRAPWSFAGLQAGVTLTPRWKRYTLSFVARDTDPRHSRLSFVLGDSDAPVLLADVSLRPGGGGVALEAGQSLEAGNLELPGVSATPAGRDYVSFLMEVERRYTQEMRDAVRATGCQAPVACSQASYGGLGGVWREASLDWVDLHAYWQHPSFPNRPWDDRDYRIENTAMVRAAGAGTLDGLAMHRVADKPFTVSEYDHPAPNEYAAEMVPLIFAYAAWQDWDGVFLFAYHGDDDDWKRERIGGYFDQAAHPGKMAFVPAAAQIFLRGYVGRAPRQQTLVVPREQVAALTAQSTNYSFWNAAAEQSGHKVSARDMFEKRTALRFAARPGKARVEQSAAARRTSNPSALRWDKDNPRRALFTVVCPGAQTIVGFAGGRKVQAGELTAEVAPTPRNFAALSLTSMDGRATRDSNSLLLTAVDKVENPGLQWNAERTFAANAWSSGPTLAEAVVASVSLRTVAVKAAVYALDGSGRRVASLPSKLAGGRLEFRIGPQYKTLWYEIAATSPRPPVRRPAASARPHASVPLRAPARPRAQPPAPAAPTTATGHALPPSPPSMRPGTKPES